MGKQKSGAEIIAGITRDIKRVTQELKGLEPDLDINMNILRSSAKDAALRFMSESRSLLSSVISQVPARRTKKRAMREPSASADPT